MINKLKNIVLLLMVFLCASCNRDLLNNDEQATLSFDSITFTDNYKSAKVDVSLLDCSKACDIIDNPSATVSVYECTDYHDTIPGTVSPVLKNTVNIAKEQFTSLNMQALVIIDRTMEQVLVDKARDIVQQMSLFLDNEDIYVSFLDAKGKVSTSAALSDEILEEDFISTSADGKDKYLYKCIYDKMLESTSADSPMTKECHFIVVLTDGVVWDEDKPYDPQHFLYQENLLNQAQYSGEACPVFYAMMNDEFDMPLDVNNTMKSVCERTYGTCFDITDLDIVHQTICALHNLQHNDMKLTFEFPDNRIFEGERIRLHVDAVLQGENRAHSFIEYQQGNWFTPIIVNGLPAIDLVTRCFIIGCVLLLLAYLVMQLLVPYIMHRIFERKYVAEYKGENTSIAGHLVPEVCYFCKTPFKPGEKVVAHCEHAMHEECWEECGYRCPEHGSTCNEPFQYYNPQKLFSTANAPYYMSWVLVAFVANIVRNILTHLFSGGVRRQAMLFFADLFLDGEMLQETVNYSYRQPYITAIFSMCITAAIAFMCRRHEPVTKQWLGITIRALVACFVGYVITLADVLVCTLFDIRYYNEVIGIISTALILASIYLILSFRSPIVLKSKRISIALMVIASSFLFVWLNRYFDGRELYFYVFGAIYIAIALSVAFDTRRVWHCFLRVEGAMKRLDVALYKWLIDRPNVPVTMGRSVDCNLQITWDAKNDIAPIQAEIREHHGNLCLFPLEPGVRDYHDNPLTVDKPMILYHGTRFRIGDIIFTYLEKY